MTPSRLSIDDCSTAESGGIDRRRRRPRQAVVGVIVTASVFLLLASPNSRAKERDAWVEVRSPHFIVVSNAGEKAARRTTVQFEQIRLVFLEMLVSGTRHTSPTITVLALKNEASLRSLIPEYWKGYHARPAGIFSHRLGQLYIALDLSAPGPNPDATIYHEYFHALSSRYLPDLPAWLAEGLADFYANTQISGSKTSVALPDEPYIDELKRATPIPLAMLFQVNHSSPYYNVEGKAFLFHAESWAVTDYLTVADRGVHRQSLLNYISDVKHGASPLDAARTEFGELAKLQTEVLEYLRCSPLDHLHAEAPPPIADSDLAARAISEAEADVYRAGFLAVQGQPDRAIPVLEKAVARNPSSALAQQNLALALFFAGRLEEATAAAARAIAIDPHAAITRYIRAYGSFRGTMLMPNPEMEGDLRVAIAAAPDFAPAYAFLAAYLATQSTHLDDAYQDARTAVSINPGNSMYQLTLAKALGRLGRYEESHAAAMRARACAGDASDQQAADSFLKFLEQQAVNSHEVQLTSGSRP